MRCGRGAGLRLGLCPLPRRADLPRCAEDEPPVLGSRVRGILTDVAVVRPRAPDPRPASPRQRLLARGDQDGQGNRACVTRVAPPEPEVFGALAMRDARPCSSSGYQYAHCICPKRPAQPIGFQQSAQQAVAMASESSKLGARFFEGVCPPGSATAHLRDPPSRNSRSGPGKRS